VPVAVRRFSRSHHFARVQQLQVERCRQVGVVQPRLARPHRVLVAAEQRQSLLDESLRCRIQVELVAQHEDQVAQFRHAGPCCVGRLQSST
jgi:hypothetical protein